MAACADATKRPRDRRYAEKTRDRGGLGGGEYPRLSASGSLPGSSIRSVMGWISVTPAGSGACDVAVDARTGQRQVAGVVDAAAGDERAGMRVTERK